MNPQIAVVRVGKGHRSDTAYAVYFNQTFIGYAVGRAQRWDRQFTLDPAEPVKPSHQFVYSQPSRACVVGLLVEDWTAAAAAR